MNLTTPVAVAVVSRLHGTAASRPRRPPLPDSASERTRSPPLAATGTTGENSSAGSVIFPPAPANKLAGASPAPFRSSDSMSTTHRDDAFLAQLQQHKAILYKVANAYCSRREDRGDLIQEILIELWQAWPRFDRSGAFAGWMQRIAINVAISFFRGESRRIRDALPIEDFGMDLAAADRVLDAEGDDLRALHQLIARLDDVNRALILLYLEGYSQDETAAMLGLSATNVATRIQRIKQKLQREYAAAEETP
jgi:RNA polymerase sigma factor (sigma-70 family)